MGADNGRCITRRLLTTFDSWRKQKVNYQNAIIQSQTVVDVAATENSIRTSIWKVLEFKPDMLDANPQPNQRRHDKRKAKSLPTGECRLLPETTEYFTYDIGTLCSLVK